MRKKNMILTVVLSIVLVLMITIGASYAYFTATMLGEDTTTITVKGGKMLITYNGGDKVDVDNIAPGNTPFGTKTFTVAGYNNTSIDMGYKISLVVESNTFSDVALKYKLISTNTDNNGTVAKNITDLTVIIRLEIFNFWYLELRICVQEEYNKKLLKLFLRKIGKQRRGILSELFLKFMARIEASNVSRHGKTCWTPA